MSEANTTTRKTIRVYGCGGTGINITFGLNGALQNQDGYAIVDVCYLDTSDSNVRPLGIHDNKNVFILEGLGGSGKIRVENFGEIKSHINAILQQFQPGDMNIVIASAGGGSGNVIAAGIASELLGRDIPVMGILIGDESTKADMQNAIGSIQTFENIVLKNEKTFSIVYGQNDAEHSRSQINKYAMSVVHALSILYSGQNGELDSMDIFNFLRPERITKCEPALALFSITKGDGKGLNPNDLMSICTLAIDDDYPKLPFKPEVQYLGLLNTSLHPDDLTTSPYHFVLSDGGVFHSIVAKMEKEIAKIDEMIGARVRRSSIAASKNTSGILDF